MTGPAQPAPPPGWYPDPDGAPGQVRWWSGSVWSDVTTPAGPGVAVQTSPLLAPPVRPTAPPREREILESGGSMRVGWVVGI